MNIILKGSAYLFVTFRFAGKQHINEKCQAEADQAKTDKNQIIHFITS